MARRFHKSKPAEPGAEKARESVTREVLALGREVAQTLRAVAESAPLRAVGSEMTHSIKRVSDKVVDAVNIARRSERPKTVAERLGKVAEVGRKRGLEAGELVRSNLAAGLREIGSELSRLARRLDR